MPCLEDALALLRAHVLEAPAPPSRHAAQRIPAALDRALLKALAKRPEERFESAEAFAEELGRIAAGLSDADGSAGGPEVAGVTGTRGAARKPAVAAEGRPRGATAGGGEAEAWEPEIGAWFEAMPAGTGGAGACAHGAADAGAGEAPVDARLFAALTAASTVVFSLIAALVLRGLGVW